MKLDIQKADIWKRLSAFMFDSIMIVMVAVGISAIFSIFLSYGEHYDTLSAVEMEYSEKYGIDLELSPEEYEKLDETEKQKYETANAEFQKDERAIYAYNMLLNLSLIMLTISLLIAFIGLELVVPIFLGHGRTLGKKIFGIAVMRTNGVKLDGQAHFIRSILGKYTMETMIPVYIVLMILFGTLGATGTIMLLLILGLQLFTIFYTRTRSAIHDLISDTVVVDYNSQLIFDTEADLIAYKTKLHADEVNKKEY